jgi:hypothetical protein
MTKRFGDWVVDARGVFNEGIDYLIDAARICEEDEGGISYWALHMIENSWVEPEHFVPALKFALEYFQCEKINWDRTLAALQADAYEEIVAREANRRLNLDTSLGLRGDDGLRLMQEVDRLKSFAWRPRERS